MKRDMDLVRDLLLKIEGGQRCFETTSADVAEALGRPTEGLLSDQEARKLKLHLDMLEEAGLVAEIDRVNSQFFIERLTWEGYDFIETMRDPDRWEKVKGAATKVGGVGFKALLEIGKSVAKGELQKIGIPIG